MGKRELFLEKSPKDLLEEFRQSGANAPFEEIVRRYAAMVFGVCLRVTGDKHDAEDATQAVFLSLALQAKTNREIKYIGPWLQKVAHRLALDVKKSKTRRKRREEKIAEEARHHSNGNGRYPGHNGNGAFLGGNGHHTSPADAPGAEELKQIMMEELNQLPAKYRMPLVMHYFGGLSREEMADQLKCNPSTLGVRVHRGKAMLGTRLAKRGIAMSAIAIAVMLEHVIREGALSPILGTSTAAGGFAGGSGIGVMIASAKVTTLIRTAANAIWFAKAKYAVIALLFVVPATLASGTQIVQQIKNHLPTLDLRQWIKPLFKSLVPSPRAKATDQDPLAPLASAPTPTEPKIHVDLDKTIGPAPQIIVSAPTLSTPPRSANQPTPIAEPEPQLNEIARAILNPQPLPRPVTKEQSDDSNTIGADALEASEESLAASQATDSRPRDLYVGAGGGGGGGKPELYTLPANQSLHTNNQVIGDTGAAIFRQLGGTNRIDGALVLGNRKGSSGQYELVAGNLSAKSETIGGDGKGSFIQMSGVNVVEDSMIVGYGGEGTVEQRGGITSVTKTDGDGLAIGVKPGAVGSFTLAGGELNATPQQIGIAGSGAMVQTGGSNISGAILIAQEPGSKGVYQLKAGEVHIDAAASSEPRIAIGGGGDGRLTLGDNTQTGVIADNGGKTAVVVRGRAGGEGSMVGWGPVALTGSLTNNGQVIADGYLQPRTLDLSEFGQIASSIENSADSGTAGWYAFRHGELKLPKIPVAAGTATYTWGETADDPLIDLVNSVRFTIQDAADVGEVDIALLSPRRDDIPTLPLGHKFIGIWSFDAGDLDFAGIDLLVRYDDVLAANKGIDENLLKLWRYDGELGAWERINDDSFWRDTASHVIAGHAPSLDFFAVSAPEPGAALTVLTLGGALLARRRRH